MPGRILHTAEFLLPMGESPMLRNGAVILDEEGEILEIGPAAELARAVDEEHRHQILMPGVINCHVHLTDASIEEPVPGGDGLNPWVRRLMASRRGVAVDMDAAVDRVLGAMSAAGTVAVGEVCNSFATFDAIARNGMRCRFIHELIGFRREKAQDRIGVARLVSDADDWPDEIRYTVGAHAPYSVSPELMRLIADRDRDLGTSLYQHLAEDPAERELYANGGGAWRAYLEEVGSWEPGWQGGELGPIALYDSLGLLNDRYVGVHLTDATDQELALLASRGARAILCPGSNLHISRRLPRFETIVAVGLRFGLGTDGRGSDPSIDVFDEARILQEHWPEHPAGLLLRALTTDGAAILDFDDLGAMRVGTRPGLISVEAARAGDDLAGVERAVLGPATRRRVA